MAFKTNVFEQGTLRLLYVDHLLYVPWYGESPACRTDFGLACFGGFDGVGGMEEGMGGLWGVVEVSMDMGVRCWEEWGLIVAGFCCV